jgi:predicted DNA-binding transcriptional regulator AlpA
MSALSPLAQTKTRSLDHLPSANKPRSKGHKRKTSKPRPILNKQVTLARQRTGVAAALLDRHQIVALVGLSYPTVWKMMCRGAFPRGRTVRHKTMWLASEVTNWIAALPVSPIRDGQPSEQKIEECETA